jgi:hypothetical protein
LKLVFGQRDRSDSSSQRRRESGSRMSEFGCNDNDDDRTFPSLGLVDK